MGVSLHLLNGSGEFVDDTFIEELLDAIAPGLDLVGGLEFPVAGNLRVLGEARAVLTGNTRYISLGLGGAWRLSGGVPAPRRSAAASSPGRGRPLMAAARPPVRIAVLGAGSIAQVVHLPILSRMRGVQVAAVADRDAHTARTIAQRFEVPTVGTSFEEVLTDDIDAVVVCTPSNRHEDQVRAALQAGKYVLCEKPLALTAKGVESLLKEKGAEERLMVAMNQRFRPDSIALRQFVAGGELGSVYYLRTGWLNRYRPRGRTWRDRKATAGGGAFMDLGLQMLDLALWTLGFPAPQRVTAHMYAGPESEVEDSAAVVVRLEGDRAINLECTWNLLAQRDRQYLHLLGSGGIRLARRRWPCSSRCRRGWWRSRPRSPPRARTCSPPATATSWRSSWTWCAASAPLTRRRNTSC